MKTLIICGKASEWKNVNELKIDRETTELWMCGTDERKGADLYFELHDIKVKHKRVIRELPDEVYAFGLPVNNTICALCVYAWLKGYKNVLVMGSPMLATHEYIEQRPALAYIIGWLTARGMNIQWTGLPKNIDYGKKEDNDNAKKQ